MLGTIINKRIFSLKMPAKPICGKRRKEAKVQEANNEEEEQE
jgi:hypothetical protein